MLSQKELEQAIQDHPDDSTHCLVYADWLEERGQRQLAYAFRWLDAHKKLPDPSVLDDETARHFGLTEGMPIWIWWSTADTGENGLHDIPAIVVDVLEFYAGQGRLLRTDMRALFFLSFSDAVQALAFALETLREIYSL